jgi:hypothetical protein
MNDLWPHWASKRKDNIMIEYTNNTHRIHTLASLITLCCCPFFIQHVADNFCGMEHCHHQQESCIVEQASMDTRIQRSMNSYLTMTLKMLHSFSLQSSLRSMEPSSRGININEVGGKKLTQMLSPAFPSKHDKYLCPVTQCYTSKVFHDLETLRN